MRPVARRPGLRAFIIVGVTALALVAIAVVVLLSRVAPLVWTTSADPWTSTASVNSSVLGREMRVQVFEPDRAGSGRLPVLFLFHGRGGDETQWMAGPFGDGVGVDRLAHELIENGEIGPLVIISAAIDDSYGVDSVAANDGYSHGPYETYIISELIPQIEARYKAGGTRASRAIGGISMGGFAALNAGLGRDGLFGSIAALSPAFFVDPPRDRLWIYGANGERDPLRLAAEAQATQLKVFLGIGDRDYPWIRDATHALAARLTARGVPAEPVVASGGHEVRTWRQLSGPMLTALYGRPD